MQNYFLLFFSITSILVAILLAKNSYSISFALGLYKKDKNKIINRTPLTGGVIVISSFIISIIFLKLFNNDYLFENTYWIGSTILIFFIGYLDDKFALRYDLRLASIFLILFLFFFFNDSWLIKNLYFETMQKSFVINNTSLFLTPFFFLLLLNSLNMSDGINGIFSIIIFIYLTLLFHEKNQLNFFLYFLIPSLIIFTYYNFKNKLYMGDSGVYFLSTFTALYTIFSYNAQLSNLSCEKIFIIFMIPGLDMLRLFISRIYKKKNPFKGDLDHLHHLLMKKFSINKTLIIYSILILWPQLLKNIVNLEILIFLNSFIYFFLIIYLKKLKKFS